jgi:hypothetical protein
MDLWNILKTNTREGVCAEGGSRTHTGVIPTTP